jgi:hypothetical protein
MFVDGIWRAERAVLLGCVLRIVAAAADKAKRDKAKAEAKKREVEAERRLQQERQRAEEALAE